MERLTYFWVIFGEEVATLDRIPNPPIRYVLLTRLFFTSWILLAVLSFVLTLQTQLRTYVEPSR